jgi:trehalose 6-phosphate phosphatase
VPLETLRQAIAGRVLFVFDLDGTLAPIASRPDAAQIRAPTRRLLASMARRLPTVVLTGRDRRDAGRMLRGVPLRMVVGNHGLDLGGNGASRTVASWSQQLRSHRRTLSGVFVERKELTLTAHYRGVEDAASTRRRVVRIANSLIPAPRIVPGKASVNLLPDIGLDKGTALRKLIRYFRARSAVYVGDDATDEDAFVAGKAYSVLTIRVGTSDHTAARFMLPSQGKMDALLQHLLDAT